MKKVSEQVIGLVKGYNGTLRELSKWLEKRTGESISYSTLSQIVTGRRDPSLRVIDAVCQAFETGLSDRAMSEGMQKRLNRERLDRRTLKKDLTDFETDQMMCR